MARGWDVWEGRPYLPPGDFILIRAHNGYRPDFVFPDLWAAAKGQYRYGRGVWGYVVPNRDPAQQAREMVDVVMATGDEPELGYWSDHEQSGLSYDQALAHTETLAAMRRRIGFYSNLNDYRNMLRNGAGFERFAWWFANPSGNPAPRPFLFAQTGTPPVDTPDGTTNIDADYADDTALAEWAGVHPAPPEEDDMPTMFVTPTRGVVLLNLPIVTAVGPDELDVLGHLVNVGAVKRVDGTDDEMGHLLALNQRYLDQLPHGSGGGTAEGPTAAAIVDELVRRLGS